MSFVRLAMIALVCALPLAAPQAQDNALRTQFALILEGHYLGPADGDIGPRSREAIASYQRRLGDAPTGSLTDRQRYRLHNSFDNAIADLDIIPVYDQTTGIWLYLPANILSADAPSSRGYRFASDYAGLELETVRVPASDAAFIDLYQRLTSIRGRAVDYSAIHGDWFVVSATECQRILYTRFYTNGREHRGFSVSYDRHAQRELNPIVVFVSESFIPFVTPPDDAFRVPDDLYAESPQVVEPPPRASRPAQPEPSRPSENAVLFSSGTGFYVGEGGVIVTNAHVVDRCRLIEDANGTPLTVEHLDRSTDIALLQGPESSNHLRMAGNTLVLGEDIVALGYPLSDILEDGLRVSTGIVSGLNGIRGETIHFTFTAPIQPGNSGGPILNEAGHVIGVVVARLSEQPMLENGDPLPQNLNFGIRSEALHMVFDIAGVDVGSGRGKGEAPRYSTAEITSLASNAVVQIICTH